MAGLYFHIPLCKQACTHCNYTYTTQLSLKETLIKALKQEIRLQHAHFNHSKIKTIYFGGGTPSLLSDSELQQIFEQIEQYFSIDPDAEITLEANPDDLTPTYLKQLQKTLVNRLSIGVQSFFDKDLQLLNRPHTAAQSKYAIRAALSKGFSNISVDLLFGLPNGTQKKWEQNIRTFLDLNLPHLTCYELTVAPQTKLQALIQSNKLPKPNPEQTTNQYRWLINSLPKHGYEHYETSNFALPGHQGVHNSNYWKDIPYLGIGPSAHSFFKKEQQPIRQWNTNEISDYLKTIQREKIPAQREVLTTQQRFHEYLMHHFSTHWGCDLGEIKKKFGRPYEQHMQEQLQKASIKPFIYSQDGTYKLTREGQLQADRIIAQFFLD